MKSGLGTILATFKRERPSGQMATVWISAKYRLNCYRRTNNVRNAGHPRWLLFRFNESANIATSNTLKGIIMHAVTLKLEGKL